MGTTIEWTDETWNPVTGCTEVSPGCDHCYARTFAERFRGTPGHYFEKGFDVQLRDGKLDLPMRWKKPRFVFVNSMSDLFHADVPDEYIARVFAVMALSKRHTFQLLTKRHSRLRSLLSSADFVLQVAEEASEIMGHQGPGMWPAIEVGAGWDVIGQDSRGANIWSPPWPLPNLWVGVSAETQQWADIRIPALLGTPAAVRWVSLEPLLGPVDLSSCRRHRSLQLATTESRECPDCRWLDGDNCNAALDWVVVGGESGRGARPMYPEWARDLRDQCQAAGVSYLFKQWGEFAPAEVGEPSPAGLRGPVAMVDPAGRLHSLKLGVLTPAGSVRVHRYGKRRAGRELDGRVWDEYPSPRLAN
ncbi:DUF5131 family protein [Kribbella sp. NPDC059898]|uniref:DUF5131 family protein n=1 Tax=Kribbella sp. NPDC059898 TaxID=3346995 RepID=UPI0036563323